MGQRWTRLCCVCQKIYEWGFWGAIGLIVMTGVGNLGAYGEALPGTKSEWGGKFSLKMVLVAVMLAFSALRTVSLALVWLSDVMALPRRVLSTLGGYYGATAVLLAAITGVAVSLAHFPSL